MMIGHGTALVSTLAKRGCLAMLQVAAKDVCPRLVHSACPHHLSEPAVLPARKVDAMHPAYKAVLIDAAGTLLLPTEPAAQVCTTTQACISHDEDTPTTGLLAICIQVWRDAVRGRGAATLSQGIQHPLGPIPHPIRRRWASVLVRPCQTRPQHPTPRHRQHIVAESTGCDNPQLFEELYSYYAHASAWCTPPDARKALQRLRDANIKLAVVSNFDTRLRPILHGLQLDSLFDAVVISAELGVEKPNPLIFEHACEQLGVQPCEAVHVGDDRRYAHRVYMRGAQPRHRNDVYGARDAGCFAWLWGLDVTSFDGVVAKVLNPGEDSDDD